MRFKLLVFFSLFTFQLSGQFCDTPCETGKENEIYTANETFLTIQNIHIDNKRYCNKDGVESFKWIVNGDTLDINETDLIGSLPEDNYIISRLLYLNGVFVSQSNNIIIKITTLDTIQLPGDTIIRDSIIVLPCDTICSESWEIESCTTPTDVDILCKISKVYPNPSPDGCFNINIEFFKTPDRDPIYQISTITGTEVRTGIFNNPVICLDRGVYIFTLIVYYDEKRYQAKVKLVY